MAAPMNVSCWFGSAIALLVLCGPTKADQQVVTVCGASKGMTVTPELGGSPTWSDDSIQGGTLTFTRVDSLKYDIIIKDALTTFSARDDRASIQAEEGSDNGIITIVATYPIGTIEVYMLALDREGTGRLIWTSMKNRVVGTTKGSLFTATCQRP
jgi:hypothetical protein